MNILFVKLNICMYVMFYSHIFQLYSLTRKFKYKYNSGCLFADEELIHIFTSSRLQILIINISHIRYI